MPRLPILSFDRGTLLLHPPPAGKSWIDFALWDDRVEKFRVKARDYYALLQLFQQEGIDIIDQAKYFGVLDLIPKAEMVPYPHQQEAVKAWQDANRQGVVVLPTAAGKTYVAQLCMQLTGTDTLIVVPTLDLMHQWYAHLRAVFPDVEIGLLGGGSRDKTPILVATYDSATINIESLGNRYGLLVFDECHHLPSDFYRAIAEYAIAPYRLGLTATPNRTDSKHSDLDYLIGPTVLQKKPQELAGDALADHQIRKILVKLSTEEKAQYDQLIATRNDFLKMSKIQLGGLHGWKQFVMISARSPAGRRAMLAHRQAKEISLCTAGKIRVLADLLREHYPERILIFTADNATVYRISQSFLIPALTHQTPVKERHNILSKFRSGEYKTLVTSHVLNEGVDVPDARIAIILSGTGSEREYIQRLGRVLRKGGKENKLAILYEVVTEDTSEERTSHRRGKGTNSQKPQQLELKPVNSYETSPDKQSPHILPKVAESAIKYGQPDQVEEVILDDEIVF